MQAWEPGETLIKVNGEIKLKKKKTKKTKAARRERKSVRETVVSVSKMQVPQNQNMMFPDHAAVILSDTGSYRCSPQTPITRERDLPSGRRGTVLPLWD